MLDFGSLESLTNQERRSDRKSDLGALMVIAIVVALLGVLLASLSTPDGIMDKVDTKRFEEVSPRCTLQAEALPRL
jgi:hypothetical protein